MNFPANLRVLNSVIATRKETVGTFVAYINQKQVEVGQIEEQLKHYRRMLEILSNLPKSWRISDPGKYYDAFFFLHGHSPQRVVVREFLPEGSACNSREEWNLYNRTRSPHDGYDYEKVPPWFLIVSLSEVHKGICEKCRSEQPIIEHYVQAEGGRDGAEWLKKRFVFCLFCDTITTISSETSSHRF